VKLVVAYCTLHPLTKAAVLDATTVGDKIHLADTSTSDTAYFELVSEHWRLGETFVVLEQDKIPDTGALRELHDCPHEWCTYPVPMAHNGQPCDFVSLSCTKFSSSLMARYPNLMERVGLMEMGRGLKHWDRLDMAMAGQIAGRGVEPHWHAAGRIRHEHLSGVTA
jgi:hypothetical protein